VATLPFEGILLLLESSHLFVEDGDGLLAVSGEILDDFSKLRLLEANDHVTVLILDDSGPLDASGEFQVALL
jgi:hypothetical protein